MEAGDRVRATKPGTVELIGDHPPTGVVKGIAEYDGKPHVTIELDDGTLVMGVSADGWEVVDAEPG